MWILLLAGASFIALISIALWLWLADVLEARKSYAERKVLVEPPFTSLSVGQAFEPVFAALWEAPILALELIESGGKRGIAVSRLLSTFHEAGHRFPEIYDGFDFEQWLQFLEGTQFVVRSEHTIRLTREGREFLDYRFMTEALAKA